MVCKGTQAEQMKNMREAPWILQGFLDQASPSPAPCHLFELSGGRRGRLRKQLHDIVNKMCLLAAWGGQGCQDFRTSTGKEFAESLDFWRVLQEFVHITLAAI